MEHTKKILPEYFEKIVSGEKTFELRLANWGCSAGDTLILQEWDPVTKTYTGREITKEVTYVLQTNDIDFWPKEDVDMYGYQIISIK
jgi:hypothetical protein